MSEKSKGDTSRIVKNPLLSASVTGLTFDDFPNKPLLLPAAPPVIPVSEPEDYATASEDHQKSVTVGQTPEIDTETLSEINLNSVGDDDCNQIDLNENNNTDIQDESILSQAASSFSQLPTVASTVFSTFSKVIKEYTPSSTTRENSAEKEIHQQSGNITDTSPPFIVPSQFSDRNDNYPPEHLPEPPRLYSPSEVKLAAPPAALPSHPANQNTYRLSAKKKTYAQIPGLSVPHQHIEQQQQVFTLPDSNKNLTYQSSFDDKLNFNSPSVQATNAPSITEERKGLSLLSSFVPPVWQNITGLVQTSVIQQTNSNSQNYLSAANQDPNTQLNTFIESNQQISTPTTSNTSSTYFTENLIQKPEVTLNPLIPTTASSSQPVSIFTPSLSGSESINANQKNINLGSYATNAPPLLRKSSYDQKTTDLKSAEYQNVITAPPLSSGINKNNSINVSQIPTQASANTSNTPSQLASHLCEVTKANPALFENSSIHQEPPKPPTGLNTGTNFRLQKGTRLYKSPFNSSIPTGPTGATSPFVPVVSPTEINRPDQYPLKQLLSSPPLEANKSLEPNSIGHIFSYGLPTTESVKAYQSDASTPFHQEISNVSNSNKNPSGILIGNIPLYSTVDSKGVEENITSIPEPDIGAYTEAQFTQLNPLVKQSDNCVKQQDSSPIQSFFSPKTDVLNVQKQLPYDTLIENQEYSDQYQDPSVNKVIPASILQPVENIVQSLAPVETNNIVNPGDNSTPFQIGNQTTTENNFPFKSTEIAKQTTNLPATFSLSNYFNQSSETDLQQPSALHTTNTVSTLNQSAPAPVITTSSPAQSCVGNLFKQDNKISVESNASTTESIKHTFLATSDPLAFFDSFQPSVQLESRINENISEDSNSVRIQDFFNNPPQNINDSGSDLNYKLVGSGVTDKRLENLSAPTSDSRALSPISNIVEPPSSSCSEFSSEFTAKIVGNLSSLNKEDLPDELLDKFEMAGLLGGTNAQQEPYKPVSRHWFYKKNIDSKQIWTPFSFIDSQNLESCFMSEDENNVLQVEGGRYDVNISERTRTPVYWAGESTEVRRCSWFYKAVDSKYVPYEEAIADLLEEEYREASESGEWHRKIALPTGETVVFHGPSIIVHFLQSQNSTDAWATSSQTPARPRVVKRDIEDFSIEQGESQQVDHLLFMVHGVGSACDLRFRPLEEVVEEFRSIANQLIQAHYKNSHTAGAVGRVEVLPVSWHSQLHSGESGIDEKLKAITLESIPKLRNFTNDTLLDILFYTSPIFCQNIMSTVAEALNKMYIKYCQRNPRFQGGVSLAGHSLGSLILFDLLCHQKPSEEMEIPNSENPDQIIEPLQLNQQISGSSHEPTSQQVSYTVGPAGTGQPYINYPQLIFHPKKFFALGSPIGMFVTIRGIDTLGLEFKFPTCTNFFHIFHPYDPVAYRIEALINPDLSTTRPVLIPHHKGRKRMHLELKETMTRVGADLKQRIVDTFKNTLDSVNFLASKNKTEAKEEIEKQVDKVLEMQLELDKDTQRSRANSTSTHSDVDTGEVDVPLGKLNDNRRIDYVLQEAPLEFFNEYLFALSSHVCYWDSEDTILFIMKEIYSSLGIRTDSQIPQQSMTIERPNFKLDSFSLS